MLIRIALAEDNELFQKGMIAVLRKIRDFSLDIVVDNGRDLLDRLAYVEGIDVVLLDIMMPEMNGVEAATQIKERYPDIKVLAITMADQEIYLQQMLEAGVMGYVLKDIKAELLEKAIRTVSEGKNYFSEELIPLFASRMVDSKASSGVGQLLTKREREVVNLIAQGFSSEKIGDALNISVKTVSNHRNNIYSKLNVQNTSELISFAYKNRILTID